MNQPSQPPVFRYWYAENFRAFGKVHVCNGPQISFCSFNHFGKANRFPFKYMNRTAWPDATIFWLYHQQRSNRDPQLQLRGCRWACQQAGSRRGRNQRH
jgi:hypothetical protein